MFCRWNTSSYVCWCFGSDVFSLFKHWLCRICFSVCFMCACECVRSLIFNFYLVFLSFHLFVSVFLLRFSLSTCPYRSDRFNHLSIHLFTIKAQPNGIIVATTSIQVGVCVCVCAFTLYVCACVNKN